jgi:hypothetical protein
MINGPGASDAALLPADVRMTIENELAAGEKAYWIGQPNPRAYARGAIGMVIFGIPWTGFALFWTFMASGGFWGLFGDKKWEPGSESGPFKYFNVCFGLFGVPFILIGLFLLSSPIWMRRKARKTVYAVTDKRVVIFEAGYFGSYKVASYGPDRLGAIERVQRADGSGDLIIERREWRDSDGDRRTTRNGLMGIADVRRVEELIRKHLANAKTV